MSALRDGRTTDDATLYTLAEAAELFFSRKLTKSALRTEARKGNLEVIRIANKDFVTRRSVMDMVERCKVPAKAKPQATQLPSVSAQETLRVLLRKPK
ncbi:hypothetical protein BN77_1668 [Rhizobium mesoamericanum STM3625]|uniref:Uncharacterized protein n=1 Tax=Rhizobium mesoamericanum STM3625 TaxID=1211777 RepID=K0PXG2_9HYPH|nr:hypothetical protein BN77_1668 [Rhizobium mesoamericanum STM3625]